MGYEDEQRKRVLNDRKCMAAEREGDDAAPNTSAAAKRRGVPAAPPGTGVLSRSGGTAGQDSVDEFKLSDSINDRRQCGSKRLDEESVLRSFTCRVPVKGVT